SSIGLSMRRLGCGYRRTKNGAAPTYLFTRSAPIPRTMFVWDGSNIGTSGGRTRVRARRIASFLIDCRDVHIVGHGLAQIIGIMHALGQYYGRSRHGLILNLRQQMMNAIETRAFLVVGMYDPPRCFRNVRAFEHRFLCLGVGFPTPPRF